MGGPIPLYLFLHSWVARCLAVGNSLSQHLHLYSSRILGPGFIILKVVLLIIPLLKDTSLIPELYLNSTSYSDHSDRGRINSTSSILQFYPIRRRPYQWNLTHVEDCRNPNSKIWISFPQQRKSDRAGQISTCRIPLRSKAFPLLRKGNPDITVRISRVMDMY